MQKYKMYIGGSYVDAASGKWFDVAAAYVHLVFLHPHLPFPNC